MNHLHRELAPLTERAWTCIDDEATGALGTILAGRRVVDFREPTGWLASSIDLGRARPLDAPPVAGAEVALRLVQPLMEVRVPFEISRREAHALDRGADDADLAALVRACRIAALAEDSTIFNGFADGGMDGIAAATEHPVVELEADYENFPDKLVEATGLLRSSGVDGPYALVLGPRCHAGVTRTTHGGGYPVIEHVRTLLDGPIIWSPAVPGSVVLSRRGGDFELTVGQDFSIGYLSHSADSVQLYVEETFTFCNQGPDAAVLLQLPDETDSSVDMRAYVDGTGAVRELASTVPPAG